MLSNKCFLSHYFAEHCGISKVITHVYITRAYECISVDV